MLKSLFRIKSQKENAPGKWRVFLVTDKVLRGQILDMMETRETAHARAFNIYIKERGIEAAQTLLRETKKF